MKRFSLTLAIGASLALASVAGAANDQFETFGTGDVALSGDAATITNDAGEYGGVYIKSKSNSGKGLTEVGFSFMSSGDVTGGAPRFSIPIDPRGGGKNTELYAFIDANRCGGTSGSPVFVSSHSVTCIVDLNNGDSYANWDAFAAANPTWRITPGRLPFVIADQPGTYEVYDISLR